MDHGAAVRRHLPPPLNRFCLPSVTPAPDLLAPSRSHSSLPSSGVFRAPLPTCLSAGGPCSLLASLTPALLLSEQLHPRWGLRYQHHTLMGPKSAPAADTSLRNVTPCSHWVSPPERPTNDLTCSSSSPEGAPSTSSRDHVGRERFRRITNWP